MISRLIVCFIYFYAVRVQAHAKEFALTTDVKDEYKNLATKCQNIKLIIND